jgi:hypothetical protein
MLPPAPIGERAADAHRFLVAQILSCQHRRGLRVNDAIEDFFWQWNISDVGATSGCY